MIDDIFRAENEAARPRLLNISPHAQKEARDKALLWWATALGIESAFNFDRDLPVGAVAASGDKIVGRGFASDHRNGYEQMHAEYMAAMDALIQPTASMPDTVVVTIEPCDNCQDFLATQPSIKRVGFGISREQVAEKGLVKPHAENIFQRALRKGLPYQPVQIIDPQLQRAGSMLLDHVQRDPITELVEIDRYGLQRDLIELNREH